MTHKEALDILLRLLKEKEFGDSGSPTSLKLRRGEEKLEAIRVAVGVLFFTYLAEKRIGAKKNKPGPTFKISF